MKTLLIMACLLLVALPSAAQLRLGVAQASITPLEEGLATQLGGYGAREGKPAEGVHDTIRAKAAVFEYGGVLSALVTLDVCSVPICLVDESLAKASIDGLDRDHVLMAASHSHAGIEGFSMDRRNIAGNPHIGIFDEKVLDFVTTRVAGALREAADRLEPVRAGAACVPLPGRNRNRRGKGITDPDLTVLRFDREDGKPLAVLVNYTAHGTIMTENEMLISGGWAGVMQRTVEALLGEGAVCMYTNGAEGDVSPGERKGGSRWEQAEDYGRAIAIEAAALARGIETAPVNSFVVDTAWVDLPPHQVPPGFAEITGTEYGVTQEQIERILPTMFPSRAPLGVFKVNGFQMVTFPGEPVTSIGLSVQEAMESAGIAYPCAGALTNDLVGYILTRDTYEEGGYEVTTSFYGPNLGELLEKEAIALATSTAGQ